MGKQATIKDVAALAGVSVATASRVLAESGYPVSPQLGQRVRESAEKLEYTPNPMAQGLRKSNCKDLALIVPNLSNPFYLQALLGVSEAIGDYQMLFCNTGHDGVKEKQFLEQMYSRQVKGVILSSVAEDASETVNKYIQKGMRFVLLDQMLPDVEIPGIQYDPRAGAHMAVEYLLSQGHQRIALATTPLVRYTRTEIFKGYSESLLQAGIGQDPSLVYECSISKAGRGSDYELGIGRQIAEEFVKNGCPATAVLRVNDMVAIGFIQALVQKGIKVPDDVSVIGFDNIPIAGAYLPALTTVHFPAQEMGRLAARMLLDAIESDESQTALTMSLAPQLMIRDSVAPLHKK